MRRNIILAAATLLILSLGVSADGPQYRPYGPPGQRGITLPPGDRRSFVGQLSEDLAAQAQYVAQASFEYFMGWNGVINEREQAVLFKTEEFAAACRLFNKLAMDRADYFRREGVRTNLYAASRYVMVSFNQLNEEMRAVGLQDDFGRMRRDGRPFGWHPYSDRRPWGLGEIRRILGRIDAEFSSWR